MVTTALEIFLFRLEVLNFATELRNDCWKFKHCPSGDQCYVLAKSIAQNCVDGNCEQSLLDQHKNL